MVKISIAPRFWPLGCGYLCAPAAQLSTDARTAVPHDVQQLVVIDYRAMQNSPAAMDLRGRVMPPELKQFDDALTKSGLNDNHDVEQLAFALFRPSPSSDALITVGVAQGQFPMQDILANFRKQKVKPALVRTTRSIRWPRREWCSALWMPRPWSSAPKMRLTRLSTRATAWSPTC
jgi:hypothetical protein